MSHARTCEREIEGRNSRESKGEYKFPHAAKGNRKPGYLQKDKSSPRLVQARNGMTATRPSICYHTAIYIESTTK